MTPAAETGPPGRTLGAWDVAVLALSGLSPAASVYVTGSAILKLAGTGAAAALLLGGAIQVLASLLYAELASAFPSSGGVYPGVAAVLGRAAGFAVVVLALVTSPAFLAFVALGLADYVHLLQPDWPRLAVALAVVAAAALTALLAIRTNTWITGAFLAAEVLGLLVLVAAGLHPVRGLGDVLLHPVMSAPVHGPVHGLAPAPFWTVALATVSGSFACSGSALAINFSDELTGAPRRIGGVVVGVGVAASFVVCLPLVLLTLGARDLSSVLASDAPVAAFLRESASAPVVLLVTLAVALAILNNLIAALLAFSRLLQTTARHGLWPQPVARRMAWLHPRFGSPWACTLLLATAAGALCLLGQRTLLVLLSGEVFTATLLVVSVLVGRRRGLTGRGSFRSPLFPLAPLGGLAIVAGIVATDWRDPGSGRPSLLLLGGAAAAALVFHGARSRLARRARSVP